MKLVPTKSAWFRFCGGSRFSRKPYPRPMVSVGVIVFVGQFHRLFLFVDQGLQGLQLGPVLGPGQEVGQLKIHGPGFQGVGSGDGGLGRLGTQGVEVGHATTPGAAAIATSRLR